MSDLIDSIPLLPAAASAIRPGQLDRLGRPFDPAKHLAKMHPRSGAWMPKGGRKPAALAPASAPSSAAPVSTSGDPTEALGREMAATMPPVSGTVAPAAAPASGEQPAPKPGAPFIAPDPGPAAPEAPAGAVPLDNAPPALSPEATGELAARALYGVTGAAIGDHAKATATGVEHANLKAAAGAYARSIDLKIVGGLALGLTVLAYLLDDKRRGNVIDRIKAAFAARRAAPLPVAASVIEVETPPAPPVTAEPAPAAPAVEMKF